MNEKELIRNQVITSLEALPDELYHSESKKITDLLVSSPFWQQANVIAVTISRKREVDTESIIRQAWLDQKRIAVPRTNFIDKTMNFYEIDAFSKLESKAFELKEPIISQCPVIEKEEIDLMIVPGVAFTKKGERLGYGGGFYDRFLEAFQAPIIALAFSCQIISTLPTESHDVKVDHIFTPCGVY